MDNERIREQHLRDASQAMAVEAARILAIDALMNDSESWAAWDAGHKGSSSGSSGSSGSSKGGSRVDKSSTYNVPTIDGMRVKGNNGKDYYYDPGIAYKGTIISWRGGTKMRAIGLDDVKGAIDNLPANTSSLVNMVYLLPGASNGEAAYEQELGLDPDGFTAMTAYSEYGDILVWYCDDTTGAGDTIRERMNPLLQHEVGHLVDKRFFMSSSVDYNDVAKFDYDTSTVNDKYGGYVSEYAQAYGNAHPEAPYTEDFADSFKEYCAFKKSGAVYVPEGRAGRFILIEKAMVEMKVLDASQATVLKTVQYLQKFNKVDRSAQNQPLKNDSESWAAWDAGQKGGSGGSKAGSHPFPDSFTKKTSGGSGVNKSSTYDVPTREMLVRFDGDMIPTMGAGMTYKNTRIVWPQGTKMRTIGLDDIQASIDKLPGKTATLIKTGVVLHAGQSPGEREYILSLGLNPDEYGGILNSTDGGQINVFYCDDTSNKGDQVAKQLDKTMQHEVGHLVDKGAVISTSGLYKQAVNEDRTHMAGTTYGGYSSEYAQQYGSAHPEAPYKEDFAEAFKDYCTYKESGASAPPVGEAARFKVVEDMMKELKL